MGIMRAGGLIVPVIDFWFSIGSTYTYLAVMRLAEIEQQTGVRFAWKPFNVRAVMIEMNNIPFANKPAKAAYMWRDIERRAGMRGLAPKLPEPYPLSELERANRVAIVGAAEGWCPAYVRASYRRWMEAGLPAGSEPNVSESVIEAGANAKDVLAPGGRGRDQGSARSRDGAGQGAGRLRLADLRRRQGGLLGRRSPRGRPLLERSHARMSACRRQLNATAARPVPASPSRLP